MRYYFLILMFLLVSCSRKSANELYTEGIKAENEKEFARAIDTYNEIIDKYEKDALADSALFRIALVYNNDLHETPKAINAYQKYFTKYPTSVHAPTALFLTGFLYNNDLRMFDSAKVVYEKFLQLYPNHDLAQSAKFELSTLGKDPGEFPAQTDDSTLTESNPRKKIATK